MSDEMLDAVVGLGSNLGDRVRFLTAGLAGLARIAQLTAISQLYETAAVGPPQPDFINAAVRLETALTPLALLESMLEVERTQGRIRTERWGPRTLDLDLLWIRGRIIELPELAVPHPGLALRVFALRPLLDVAPEASDPRTGAGYQSTLAALPATALTARPINVAHWPPRSG